MGTPRRVKLYLPAGIGGPAFLSVDGSDDVMTLVPRYACLLLVLWEVRAADMAEQSAFQGWRTRSDVARKYCRLSGGILDSPDTITRYATAILKAVAARPELGLSGNGDPLLIERRPTVGLRIGEGIEFEIVLPEADPY